MKRFCNKSKNKSVRGGGGISLKKHSRWGLQVWGLWGREDVTDETTETEKYQAWALPLICYSKMDRKRQKHESLFTQKWNQVRISCQSCLSP